MRDEDYYLHLRKTHNYSDDDASVEANNPRRDYDAGLVELKRLMAVYTETLIEDA
jgi:hypothetical protein